MNEKQKFVSETVLNLSKALRHELENRDNFQAARKQLEQGSLIIYLNHFHKLDVPVYGQVLLDGVTTLDKIAIFAAMKQLDPKRGKLARFQRFAADGLMDSRGLKTILVVQDDEKEMYDNADDFNRKAFRNALEVLKTRGNVLVMAPEGTRSKDGQLQQAQDGMELLFKLSRKNALAMPLVLQPFPVFPRQLSIIPFATKIRAIAGKPFSYDEIIKEQESTPETSITTLMMRHMATLLREQNRGVYK